MTIARSRALLASGLLAAGFAAGATPLVGTATGGSAVQDARELQWYKGNTHTHTINSDGDSTPDDVVRWYREHEYQFLVLTDHNYLTSVRRLNALHGADGKFLVLPIAGPF